WVAPCVLPPGRACCHDKPARAGSKPPVAACGVAPSGPDRPALAVGGEDGRLLGGDAQQRSGTVADAAAHADIEEEDQAVEVLGQLARLADSAAGEANLAGLVPDRQMLDAQRLDHLREPFARLGRPVALLLPPRSRV